MPGSAWQGLAVTRTYRVGPGPVRLSLKIENTREQRTIRNVIATLKGIDEPQRKVLLSNHYDAWVYGGVDPSSGTAAMLALGRALGKLAAEGLRPRRTIVIGEWDAEEYTLTGSTEWGEQYERDLKQNAVVCINVDASALGEALRGLGLAPAVHALREAARDFPDPDDARQDARRRLDASGGSRLDGPEKLPVAILGSGSDYTVFFNHLGIASTDLVFDGPYGVYHSVYDTHRWMATQGDPGFVYHAAMAKYAGLLALRFANADALPFDASAYGREIARYAEDLKALDAAGPPPARSRTSPRSRGPGARAAGAAQKAIAARVAGDRLGFTCPPRRQRLAVVARAGAPRSAGDSRRPWFRHLVYAPLPSYEAETLPAIREALVEGRQ